MITTRYVILNCVLPLVVGSMIYLLWRSDELMMFQVANSLGMLGWIEICREVAEPAKPFLPPWSLFSLPYAIAIYAYTSFCGRLWRSEPMGLRVGVAFAAGALALGCEGAQWLGVVPGTFDWMDVALCCTGALSGYWVAR